MGPWPWPSEITSTLLRMPICSAKVRKALVGSEPMESTKMSGRLTLASSKQAARSKGGGSTNLRSMLATTKSCAASSSLSGRMVRRMHMFCRPESAEKRPGMGSLWLLLLSKMAR